MSIKNAKPHGRFKPHPGSPHIQRTKNIFKGTDSNTGKIVHFFERDGLRFQIAPADFKKWIRIGTFGC